MRRFIFLAAIVGLGIFSACVPHKKITYFNDLGEVAMGDLGIAEPYEYILGTNDIVSLTISSISKETNTYFFRDSESGDSKYGANSYRISSDGTIDLPLVGKIELAGKTLEQAEETVRENLETYVQKPTVNIRLMNFKVTILGEVTNPGSYELSTPEVTVLEAIGMAGDLTIYGKRDNILIVRNSDNEKKYYRINLNDSSTFSSANYFLQNNDVIYVEPSKGKTSGDDNLYRVVPMVLSSLTLVVVMVGLFQ